MTEGRTDDAAADLPAADGEDAPVQVDVEVDDPAPEPPDEAGIPDEPEVFVEEIEAEQIHPAPDVPETGDPRVDDVLSQLSGIENRPTAEHVGVYDEVHRGLQDSLANLDQG